MSEQEQQAQLNLEQSCFGEQINAQGKTLIAVQAKPRLGKPRRRPIGFLEISAGKTRYIQAKDRKKLIWALCLTCFVIAMLLIGMSRKAPRRRRPALW